MASRDSDNVSVINFHSDTNEQNITLWSSPAGTFDLTHSPAGIAGDFYSHKIYVAHPGSNTVSVIDGSSLSIVRDKKEPHDITVGQSPGPIAFNPQTHMIYVGNTGSHTISVINGFSPKVAAGVTFNVSPGNSGTITCPKKEYPTNIYLYIDVGTNCTAQPNKDFQFSGWVENLNGNSTILLNTSANSTNSTSLLSSFLSTLGIIKPNDASATLTVNRYGTFTANFKPIPPPIPPEFWLLLMGIILSSLFGWSIPSIMGWVRARTKRKESVKEYDDIIKRLSKTSDQKSLDTINNRVISAYTNEKINEFQYKILDKKISEYYDKIKDQSNSGIGKNSSKRSPI